MTNAQNAVAQASLQYRLSGISKEYQIGPVTVQALKGVDLSIASGEFIVLRGPSGSGKSTLLNILGLIDEPTAGTIEFAGQSVVDAGERMKARLRRESIGFIFQNFNLVPVLSALENVEYALYLEEGITSSERRRRALETLAEVGLAKFVHHKPAELSGGQRQRVSIARALVKNPRVIIADEPTANLDSKTAMQILEMIKHLKNVHNTSVVLATHDEALAKHADAIITLHDGEIVKG